MGRKYIEKCDLFSNYKMRKKLYNLILEFDKEMRREWEDGYLYYWSLEDGEIVCRGIADEALRTDREIESILISKSFGFVKWLLDNYYIDENIVRDRYDGLYHKVYNDFDFHFFHIDEYEELLMILATRDNPLTYLNLIIK